jgi:hypothetical protein
MTSYPVRYSIEHPPRSSRINLLVRAAALIALGALGLSLGTVFLVAYLILPVYAVSRLSGPGDLAAYRREEGPRIVAALRWLAALGAWAGLTAEQIPGRSPQETVMLEIDEAAPAAMTSSPIWRVLTGIPSALVLAFLCWIGTFVWLWAALSILVRERVGAGAFQYLVGLQRWSIRLLAYQAALVDEYPPFSFSDAPALPAARVAT